MTEKDSGFHSGERPDPYDGGAEMPFARPERDVIGLGCEKPQALTCYIIRHIEPLAGLVTNTTPSFEAS